MAQKKFSYNNSIEEIEIILNEIETKNIDIDQLTTKIKKALSLISQCKKQLQTTEDEVSKLLANIDTE